jgi:biopolymer transport protein ExbD
MPGAPDLNRWAKTMQATPLIFALFFCAILSPVARATVPALNPTPVISVYVDAGKIYCDGQILSIEALQFHIAARIKVDEIEAVFIKGTIYDQFGEIVEVLDACRQVPGLRYVTISTRALEDLPEYVKQFREKKPEPNQPLQRRAKSAGQKGSNQNGTKLAR